DDVERERYNPKTGRATTDGDWTWVRKVIFEGEEIELTETGDNLQYINASAMVKGSWYKVTFNANNEVISSASVFGNKADMVVGPGVNETVPATKAEAIYRAVDINPSINEYDTVVFQRVYVGTSNDVAQYVVRPSLVGNTLYVETKNDTGVRVAEDVKTVLIQTKANKGETTYYTTSTQLKNIIDDLNDNGEGYKFQMNLVILKGAVRYVVIRDDIKDGYKPSEPTGSVKVSFFDTQYPVTGDNRYDFYVNGKLVTSFDETVPGEKSFKVAANDAIRVLARGNKNFGSANGEVKVDTASKITGNVIANGTILEFKATTSLTLADGIAATGSSGSSAIDEQFTSVKLILKDADGKVVQTLNATDAHIMTAADVAATGKYNGKTAGDLYIAFEIPANLTVANASAADIVAGGFNYLATTATLTGATGIGNIAATNLPDETKAGKDTTITFESTISATSTDVEFVLDSTYTLDYASDATTKVLTSGGSDLKLKFKGIDDDVVGTVKVSYKVEGVVGGPKEGVCSADSHTSGVFTTTALTGATLKPAADADKVVVTITVEPKTVKYVGAGTTTHKVDTIAATAEVGAASDYDLPDFAVVAAELGKTIVDGSKAKITFTVSGIEGGVKTFTTEELIAASNKYTVDASAYKDSTKPKINADGSSAVTITITKVEITSVKAAYTAAITNAGTTGDKVNDAKIGGATGATSAADVPVTGGKFTVKLTLSDTAGTGEAKAGKYIVTGEDPVTMHEIKAGVADITFEVTASDVATYNFTVQYIG
ncbi:MAG: hypothetical protein HFF47_04185, partial [Lawsonibacter sp.]|nr:hypothetical protein [Lawsonibacter sp.]